MACTVYGYMRLTPDAHKKHGHHYRQQLTKAGAADIYEDIPVPLFDPRPQFAAMLEAASKGDAVAVVKVSHLSADPVSSARLVIRIENAGLDFIALDAGIDTRKPNGKSEFAQFLKLSEGAVPVEGGDGGGP